MLNRTDSLTHRDCGNQDMVTIAELCLNRIKSYTAGLSGYKYSTVAVDCNSSVWAFLLPAFCPNISCPISGIQPFFVSLQSNLENIVLLFLHLLYVHISQTKWGHIIIPRYNACEQLQHSHGGMSVKSFGPCVPSLPRTRCVYQHQVLLLRGTFQRQTIL